MAYGHGLGGGPAARIWIGGAAVGLLALLDVAGCASTSPAGGSAAGASGSGGDAGLGGSGGGIDVEPSGAGGSAAPGADGGGSGGMSFCQPAAPMAGGVFDGDLTIQDGPGALAAQAYTEVRGGLRVSSSFSGDLDLPNLTALGGDLIVEGRASPLTESRITRLKAPNLTRIGGDLWLYLNFALVETDLWKLETIGGRLYVHRNTVLERLGMDSLRQVGSPVTNEITGNERLPKCLVDAIYAGLGWSGRSSSNGTADIPCETICGRLVAAHP